jgi:3-oxoacyl-[acyl-carrier-protein] synthase II
MTKPQVHPPAAITGVGPVSALGNGADAFFAALCNGRSGTRQLTRCAPPPRGCAIAAEVEDPAPLPLDPANPMPRAVQLALHAARLTMADARYEGDRERVGVVVGTGVGNADVIDAASQTLARGARVSPATAFRAFGHAAACEIARELDLRGPVSTVTSGCNSGADALGQALDWLRLGRADAVLVGGTEAELTPTFLGMMTAARALTVRYNGRPQDGSLPFDTGRDGNVPGEGAGFLLLESVAAAERRKAHVRALLRGYASRAVGRRTDYDPFNPVFDPAPMLRAMRAALADGGVTPAQLSAVSANGSSSVFYDVVEATAITELLGERATKVPVVSVKGALGQTGAVTPALQAIAAALSIEHGLLPPTRNHVEADPRVGLRVLREPLAGPVEHVLCNAIGFGGFYHSSLVLGR